MNNTGKGKPESPPRKPRETSGPIRSQKRIGNDEDQSRVDLFRQNRSGHADAPAADHGQIAERAYLIWRQCGCPSDQDVGTWYEAEAQLKPGPSR